MSEINKSRTKSNNRGSLWKNLKKETSSQPDYTGNCKVDEKHYFLAGWLEDGSTLESKRIALAFTPITDEEPKDDEEIFF